MLEVAGSVVGGALVAAEEIVSTGAGVSAWPGATTFACEAGVTEGVVVGSSGVDVCGAAAVATALEVGAEGPSPRAHDAVGRLSDVLLRSAPRLPSPGCGDCPACLRGAPPSSASGAGLLDARGAAAPREWLRERSPGLSRRRSSRQLSRGSFPRPHGLTRLLNGARPAIGAQARRLLDWDRDCWGAAGFVPGSGELQLFASCAKKSRDARSCRVAEAALRRNSAGPSRW